MSEQPIRMRVHRERRLCVPTPYWEFEPSGKTAWVQRRLWALLMWLGCLKTHREETVEVITLPPPSDILGKIMQARAYAFEAVRRKPSRVLIGPEDMDEIMGTDYAKLMAVGFTMTGQAGYNREIYGLPIEVVPHMKGVLVL